MTTFGILLVLSAWAALAYGIADHNQLDLMYGFVALPTGGFLCGVNVHRRDASRFRALLDSDV